MKKILIVDDSNEIRKLVKTTLDTSTCRVYEAASGAKAIEIATKQVPDLIIMDVIMPGTIDGIEATRVIKNAPGTCKCHVIILTGSNHIRQDEIMSAGADDVFTKPFSPLDLIAKVEQVLGSAV